MSLFFYKLVPPRSTFPQDMTDEEKKVMQEHFAYWEDLLQRGIVVVVGPVFDPKGSWGMAVVQVDDEQSAHSLGTNDPARKAGLKFEIYPLGPNSKIGKQARGFS